ncbi:MAG TPA: aldehyde dehydrogenase family protein [Acidimicrobiales bacterium]|jgi:aldehyde dehydrogenase (NAD+)|nr:aldehyde dehydrogenase family protein [Acidimicrobiales bacterium]
MTSLADRPTGAGPAGPGDAGQLVERLRATFAEGRTRTLEWRLRQLRGIARLVTERESEIAAALASDLGRNAHDSWFGDVASTSGEVEYAIKHLRKWMKPTRVRVPLALMGGKASYRYEPLGVVLVIGPWNYPFYLCLGPMIGALAAGNCVILKPSEHAPTSSATMARLIPQYLDPDAVAVVEGEAQVTQDLIEARMDHIFFTGGTEIGRKVMQAAAPHLTPVTLELGGKSPAIVTRDADVEVAARRILWGKLFNSGQTCLAPDYVLVDNQVKTELVDRLQASLNEMRAGEPPDQRIVNARQHQRLSGLLDENPGQVVTGGGHSGTSVEPTIVVDPDPDSAVMRGEIFGPILPVIGVPSLGDAIEFVNSREKPLAAYVFSNRRADQERVFEQVPSGGATANHTLMHVLAPQLPFGGVGESGMGAYHGKWGFECFSHRKSTLVMRSRPDLKMIYPPYSERAKKLLRRLA